MINLGSKNIPLNAATKTFAILAKRGAGKTYTGAVLAEEFHKNNIPFIVFDPIDVWWGLGVSADGKSNGIPIVVFGTEHADIPLTRDMGRDIARAIVKENISCVISTFGMPKVAQRHLISEFSEEILNINNIPRHIFIEEAHEFVPQRVFGGLGKTFNAVSNLVVMGRNRGIGVTLINQRAATINKDVLTQIDTLLAFQNSSPQDRKALQEWVEYHAVKDDFDKFMESLPSLPKGEGWIWSPEFLGVFEKIKIRKRETFHPDREQGSKNLSAINFGGKYTFDHVESFIENFIKRPLAIKSKVSIEQTEKVEVVDSVKLVDLRNEYESKLMQKDIELRKMNDTLNQLRKLLGGISEANINQPHSNNGHVDMWLEKLGNGGPSRILKFLDEKAGLKFTRSQIALAVRLTPSSIATYIPILKRNKLIIENNNECWINPDL